MFTVKLLLAPIPNSGTEASDDIVKALFYEEVSQFGNTMYASSWTTSGGPLGAKLFYQFYINPSNHTNMVKLIEYARVPRHGFILVTMRDNHGQPAASRAPVYLSLSEHGNYLDELTPTQTSGLSALLSPEQCDTIDLAIADWINVRDYLDRIEIENRMLRAMLNLDETPNYAKPDE